MRDIVVAGQTTRGQIDKDVPVRGGAASEGVAAAHGGF